MEEFLTYKSNAKNIFFHLKKHKELFIKDNKNCPIVPSPTSIPDGSFQQHNEVVAYNVVV